MPRGKARNTLELLSTVMTRSRRGPRPATTVTVMFQDFNVRYFGGRLRDWQVHWTTSRTQCCPAIREIHIARDEEDVEAALVHEMAHAVTGGDHDEQHKHKAQLRRIAEMGCAAASRELAQEEWGVRAASQTASVREQEPDQSLFEAIERILRQVGFPPSSLSRSRGQIALAWQRAAPGQQTPLPLDERDPAMIVVSQDPVDVAGADRAGRAGR